MNKKSLTQRALESDVQFRCTIEIETFVPGTWVSPDIGEDAVWVPAHDEESECANPATWLIFQRVGGQEFGPLCRCAEHIEGTVSFIIGEATTTEVRVTRR